MYSLHAEYLVLKFHQSLKNKAIEASLQENGLFKTNI